ncbi:MAG: DUF1203 domain-containing protein [Pyrinomonadaceae bacterium]
MNFRVTGIPPEIARKARETMRSPQYGHPAHADLAKGYGPCRSCLRTFERDKENRILFTYNAFAGLSNLPLPGPIFIHQDDCQRYEASEFPPYLRSLPIILEGMGRESWLIAREKVADENFEMAINRLFAHAAIDYVHLRNAEAGCFIARIERLGEN